MIPPLLARFEEVKQIENKFPKNQVVDCQVIGTKKPNPLNRQPSSEKQLPDLVDHNLTIFNDKNGTNVCPEGIHFQDISDDYMKHVIMDERNKKTLEQTPPHLYNQQIPVNKKHATNILLHYLCLARTGSTCAFLVQNLL